mgnify:CR=1 FL=1
MNMTMQEKNGVSASEYWNYVKRHKLVLLGFILASVAMLNDLQSPDEEAIRAYLAGNLCRCGSYRNILGAVRAMVAAQSSGPGGVP